MGQKSVDNFPKILYNRECALKGARQYCGGIAQLARAFGSYPKCHRFESSYRYHAQGFAEGCGRCALQSRRAKRGFSRRSAKPCRVWPHGQAVKTSPFHGGNPGSIPGGVTKNSRMHLHPGVFFFPFFQKLYEQRSAAAFCSLRRAVPGCKGRAFLCPKAKLCSHSDKNLSGTGAFAAVF